MFDQFTKSVLAASVLALAAAPAAIAQLPTLAVTDTPDPVRLADATSTAPATFDVTIQNTTQSVFQDAKFSAVGSSAFANAFTSATASQGTCSTAIQTGCSLGNITPGATVTARFVWAANAPEQTVTTRWLLDEAKDPFRRVEAQVQTTIIVGPPVISDVTRSGTARRGFSVGFRLSEAVPTLAVWLERKRGRRYRRVKVLTTVAAAAGAQRLKLAAAHTRRLADGTYRIRLQATAADGAKSNIGKTRAFRV